MSFAKFNAVLNTDVCDRYNNAELTLTLRIGFRQINPAGGAAHGTHNDYGDATESTRRTVKWTNASWQRWRSNFIRSAERFWHGKFWLVNDSGSFAFTEGTSTYFPNVWCRFKLEGRDAAVAGNHHTIDVVRLHPSETWFGSHSTLYDSLDTKRNRKATTSLNKPVFQRAHVHEVGHLMGLNHVDVGKPHCLPSTNTNASACYGVADADKISVMGSGMKLRIENAYPWREVLRYFALEEVIKAINPIPIFLPVSRKSLSSPISSLLAVWPAKLKRHYPRTEAELKVGRDITVRPNRGMG
ncbi:MAG: hypothetical protein ACYSTS_16850 [Planctomycetota bacterium]|jgi:hypothetical protein